MKLGPKIMTAFLIGSLTPFVAFSLISTQLGYRTVTRQVHQELRGLAAHQRARLQDFVAHQRERLRQVSSRTQLRISLRDDPQQLQSHHRDVVHRILDDVLETVDSYESIWILAPNGAVVAAAGTDGSDGSTRSALDRAAEQAVPAGTESFTHLLPQLFRQDRPTGTGQHFYLAEDGRLKVYLSTVLMLEEQYLGLVLIRATTDELLDLLRDHNRLGKTGEIVIAKRKQNGDALYLTPLRFDSDAALRRTLPKGAVHVPMTHALRGKVETFTNAIDYRGEPILAATEYLPETDWGLVVKIDKAEAYAPVRRLRNAWWLAAAATFLVVAFASLVMSRAITRPLVKLTRVAARIGRGYGSLPAVEGRQDEIGSLARTFHEMSDQLLTANAALQTNLDELKQAERTRSQMAAIVAHSDDAIISKELDGTITSWNRGAERIYGYRADEAIGQNISLLWPPERRDELPSLLGRVRRGETIENLRDTRLRKDGTLLDVSITISPIKAADGTAVGRPPLRGTLPS